MPHPMLDEVKRIKQRATALRNLKKYQAAIEQFDVAIDRLLALLALPDVEAADTRAARAELADTYGMKGGTYRRWTDLPDHRALALEQYRKGLEVERSDRQSTYNAGNVITLSICDEKKGLAPALRVDLDRVIEDLAAVTGGPRADEFWAWSDLAQFYLLRKDLQLARATYQQALQRGPKPDELKRHLDLLRELAEGTRLHDPELSGMISATLKELEQARQP
jgi:tetratricopeptide (TPR) repeat protein